MTQVLSNRLAEAKVEALRNSHTGVAPANCAESLVRRRLSTAASSAALLCTQMNLAAGVHLYSTTYREQKHDFYLMREESATGRLRWFFQDSSHRKEVAADCRASFCLSSALQ